jgi:LPPG:FO 2-phospho-L-lactate transferase
MIVALSGGTGGAKLIEGLAAVLDPAELTIICNTGDDCVFHGLDISPDIDTITYTLAGLSDPEKGWGIRGDTFFALEQLRTLGNESWFALGDRDLATHIMRTRLLREGYTLSEVTEEIRRTLKVAARILPMSDQRVETRVRTSIGEMSFQEFFVKHRWAPEVIAVSFAGADRSRPASGVLESIREADAIVLCPSNPITSIGPILAVPEIRATLESVKCPVIGVSPLIGDKAISGPAHKLMRASGRPASALGVAQCYGGILKRFFVAVEDADIATAIRGLGIEISCANIRMRSLDDRRRLASEVLAWTRK